MTVLTMMTDALNFPLTDHEERKGDLENITPTESTATPTRSSDISRDGGLCTALQ